MKALLLFSALSSLAQLLCPAATLVNNRPAVVLTNAVARVAIDLAGGSFSQFQLGAAGLNPLSWAAPRGQTNPQAHGHFLCLDRWGPPSASEGAQGMPYHGEASNVHWTVEMNLPLRAVLRADLPMAGLGIRRTVQLADNSAVFLVREEISNQRALGRIYNAVQHPTIAPPFLDETTLVDCNGTRGFAQGGSLPNPEESSSIWPSARQGNAAVDLRRLSNDPNPNVVSFAIEDSIGWITAATPSRQLLIGYVWRTRDYPWVSLWRDVRDGKPAARGLEFGTTGLHQPFPILARKAKIWDRPLFEHIDSRENVTKSYLAFLLPIPADFQGVETLKIADGKIILKERGRDRILETRLGSLDW